MDITRLTDVEQVRQQLVAANKDDSKWNVIITPPYSDGDNDADARYLASFIAITIARGVDQIGQGKLTAICGVFGGYLRAVCLFDKSEFTLSELQTLFDVVDHPDASLPTDLDGNVIMIGGGVESLHQYAGFLNVPA